MSMRMSRDELKARLEGLHLARIEKDVLNDQIGEHKVRALVVSIHLPDGRSAFGLSYRFKAWEALENAYEMIINRPLPAAGGVA